ncbi:MAG: hypothetical protein IT565_07485 [Rhodospirillales bacterium]|nr:hypothetical protein [Rhodospirillales bacterium]
MKGWDWSALPGLKRLRLIWSIAAITLLTFGSSYVWFTYDEYRRTLEREFQYLESNARIADAQLSGLLRNLQRLLGDIGEDMKDFTPDREPEYDLFLQERKRHFPEIRSLVVINAEGRVTLTGNPNLKGFDASGRDYFMAHRDQVIEPNFYASKPFKTSFGDIGIAFSLALRDAEGRFLGAVVSGVDPKYFEAVLAQVRPSGAGSVVGLFRLDGDLVYRLPDPERFFATNIAANQGFAQHLRSGEVMTRQLALSASDGIKRMYVFRIIGSTRLGVAVSRGYDEVMAGWWRNLILRLVVFVLAAMVVIGLTAVVHRRQRESQDMEARLRQSVDRLTSSNTELERFAYVASHDLREPVRTVVSFSQMLGRHLGPQRSPEATECLGFVIGAPKRMDSLVSELLVYARITSDVEPFQPVDLNQVIDEVRKDIAFAIEQTGAEFAIQPLPTVMGIKLQIHQLVQNLTSNALKFQTFGQKPRLEVSATEQPEGWRISFTDNGIGIDPRYADQVFEIFKRLHTEKAYPGTGMGLAICRRIMERHQGRIELESAGPGQGSAFHLDFPKERSALRVA